MIAYSPAKINLGLAVLGKRPDGFHLIDSYLYPVPLYDIIEIAVSEKDVLIQSGMVATLNPENNLVFKALKLLRSFYAFPPLKIHLHKQIPLEAGLGGGSGDAITLIKMLNQKFALNIKTEALYKWAEELGSDCPFFVESKACRVGGRGEKVELIDFSLSGFHIYLIKPPKSMNTAYAFSKMKPNKQFLPQIEKLEQHSLQNKLINQFEEIVASEIPEIKDIKAQLIKKGAVYSAMSGSGSCVLGLFKEPIEISFPASYFYWHGVLQ